MCRAAMAGASAGSIPAEALSTESDLLGMDGAAIRPHAVSTVVAEAVLLAPESLGVGQPRQLLCVGADQILLVEGVAVPARLLINGHTIRAVPPVPLIRPHGSGAMFAGGVACGLNHAAGPDQAMQRVCAAMFLRAGLRPGPLRGHLESYADGWMTGFAYDGHHPAAPVWLAGPNGACAPAWLDRPDLVATGLPTARCGFRLRYNPASPLLTRVERMTDGAALPGTPMLYDGPDRQASLRLAGLLTQAPFSAEAIALAISKVLAGFPVRR